MRLQRKRMSLFSHVPQEKKVINCTNLAFNSKMSCALVLHTKSLFSFSLEDLKGSTSGFQKNVTFKRFVSVSCCHGKCSSLNDKTAFHWVSAAIKLVLAGACVVFLRFWKVTLARLHGFWCQKALFSLQLTTALLSIEPAESVTWQHSKI